MLVAHPILISHNSNNKSMGDSACVRLVFVVHYSRAKEHSKKINRFFYTELGWENNLGSSFEDYLNIMTRLHQLDQKLKIHLVLDLNNYYDIFSASNRSKYFHFLESISHIYLFSFSQSEAFEAAIIKNQNKLIDCVLDNFQAFISKNEKEHIKQGKDKSLLSNFNILGMDNFNRKSKEIRMKIYACINLQQKYYQDYLKKFQAILEKSVQKVLNNLLIEELVEALKQLKGGKVNKFYKRMFALYKRQSRFYYIVNNSLKRFGQESFNWDEYALPIALLFKAIKSYFNDQNNKKQIEKLFDKNGQCIVWRAAKFSNDQLKKIQLSQQKQYIYFEHLSFTSTSLSKAVALNFLDPLDLRNSCIIKYKIKKPSFKKQVDRLEFIFFSFAYLFGMHSQQDTQELQILLNSLTVYQIQKSSSVIKINQVKKMNDQLGRKFRAIYQKIQLPVIQMRSVQNLIDQRMLDKFVANNKRQLPNSIRNYLTTIDILKNYQLFDIGHAFQYSGNLQRSYRHFRILINQQENKVQKDAKQIYYLESRLVQILQKMDNIDQALIHTKNVINICKTIEKEDQNITRKQYHMLYYKIIDKSCYILQEDYYYHQALAQVNNQLQKLLKKVNKQKRGKQASLFQYAEFLILRGLIYFKQGQVIKARNDIEESKQKIQQILIDIDYQKLKQQTFYIQFIIHFLIDEKVQWNKDQYFKKQRAKNIEEATMVFGGEKQLLKVQKNSAQLAQQINNFIQKRKKQIQDNKDNKDNKFTLQQSLVISIEKQFRQHEKTKQLEAQLKTFFFRFQQIIKTNQNQTQKVMKNLEQEAQKILVQQIPNNFLISHLQNSERKLVYLKQSILQCKLMDWKSIFPSKVNWFQIQKKFDEYLLLKRQQNFKLIEKSFNRINKMNYRKYCEQSIKEMGQLKIKYNDQGYPFPQRLQSKLCSLTLKMQQLQDQEQQQITTLNQIINSQSISTNSKTIRIIQAYLLKIRLIFSQAELQFQELLYNRTHLKIKQTRDQQAHKIKDCRYILDKIEDQMNQLQKKNIYLNEEHKISYIISEKKVQIELWKLRLVIFRFFLVKQMVQTQQQKLRAELEKCFVIVNELIQTNIKEQKRQQYLADYHIINSWFFSIVQNYTLSFNNIEKGLALMNGVNKIKQIKTLTKIFFMFTANANVKLDQYQQQLIHIYKFYEDYPSYWRVCLAYHFHFRFKKSTQKSIKKCIFILKTIPTQKLKLHLLQECEIKFYLSYISDHNLQQTKQSELTTQNPQKSTYYRIDLSSIKESLLQKHDQSYNSTKEKELQTMNRKQTIPQFKSKSKQKLRFSPNNHRNLQFKRR